ncbi:NF-X1-type zinc finger protein NFXL2 isoform X2 [Magnolia sinica]|uniref:NF-X1-type zinc finger protein NFXL2 isoform X2 n=1 Tax=Magnolia sinica TaxID=86752 RepID=UPI0026588879|nr:NF-X1-type zinc finger protein NFXL2 isoform X2 [Magnolia sinica]
MASASLPPKTAPSFSSDDSDTDSSSSSSSIAGAAKTINISSLEESIFQTYLQTSGISSQADLSKIRSFLLSSRTGALSCLICLERIRPADPVWSCSSSCHAVFHLFCIQSWARQASALDAQRSAARLSRDHFPSAPVSSNWHCPKCRAVYSLSAIPRTYRCFCGKLEDPPADPWILPHSCGEICGRPLSGNCGHDCLLLCHPGPCPPCPKLVRSRCFCGSVEDVRRCALKVFSCSGPCSKLLACGIHRCSHKCHDGPCPPCREKGIHRCLCGKTEEERECCGSVFQCESPCGAMLGCGKHACGQGCHSGPCGDCPLQGKRSCPCGKREYVGVSCDVPVPTCGSTCEKMLSCGLHRCPERCHRGPCVETCRTVVMKSCRCGSLKKEVPCYQDLVCERKCQKVRDCGRHACKRRCCDGDCPSCSEICGRKLRCNNHKCPSPCHRGVCAPCPLMVSISCSCGETHFESHRCHYGACPPCLLICEEEFTCGHKCQQRCHGPKPAPNPQFTLKPKKIKSNQQPKCSPGSPCPPCQELVWRSCLGQHIGAERLMLCSAKATFACQNLCGNPLQCGNHYCEKPCHVLNNRSSTLDVCESSQKQIIAATDTGKIEFMESCDECFLPCQKERKPTCPHPCPLPCHPGSCPPCKVLVKRACHCGSMVHVFECTYYNNMLAKEQQSMRSCGGPCHRKLPNCSHLCPEICHPGECLSPERCSKKVVVRCACQNLKKEWLCQDVQAAHCNAGRNPSNISKNQFGLGLLPCNSECAGKLKAIGSELQFRKTKVIESKVADSGHVPKRKKRRERVQDASGHISKWKAIGATLWKCFVFIVVVVAVVAAAYYGYKGLFWLSDWMNEIEERRQRKRFPRI